jgi:hypothetical protein
VIVVAWRGGGAIRQTGGLGIRAVRATFIKRPSEKREGRRVFRYREEGKVGRFEEPDTHRERGGNRKNRKDSRRPSDG